MPPQEPVLSPQALQNERDVTPPPSPGASKLSLQDLIREIHQILGPDGGLDSAHIDATKVIRLMEQYSSNADDWSQYTLFDPSRPYTRNLIDDGNGKFNLMILAWSQGQQSPIHNHSGSHCIMKILDGQLEETLFEWPTQVVEQDTDDAFNITDAAPSTPSSPTKGGKPLTVSKVTQYHPNQTTYVHDNIGLHRISNPSQHRGAVSLHLYTPPYKVCKTFEEKTGHARSSGICTFYSVGGVRVER